MSARWLFLLCVPLLLALGCGETDKGKHRDKDRPRSGDKVSHAGDVKR